MLSFLSTSPPKATKALGNWGFIQTSEGVELSKSVRPQLNIFILGYADKT